MNSRKVLSFGSVDAFQKRILGRPPIRFAIVIVLIFAVIGIPIAIVTARSGSQLAMPSTGVVTLTGFGTISPANPSGDPTSVVLSTSEAALLRNKISTIPSLSMSGTQLACMEQEKMFTITVKAHRGISRSDWIGQADLCPAPGILYVHGPAVGKPKIARYCSLLSLFLSFFPKGTANGTRMGLHFCR
jgi:hypothetical protein